MPEIIPCVGTRHLSDGDILYFKGYYHTGEGDDVSLLLIGFPPRYGWRDGEWLTTTYALENCCAILPEWEEV